MSGEHSYCHLRPCSVCTDIKTIAELNIKVADLKARLKAIRKASFSPDVHGSRYDIQHLSDLRRKNWRLP